MSRGKFSYVLFIYISLNPLRRVDNNPALDAFSVSGSSSPALSSHSNNRSNSHSPKTSGMVSPDGDTNNRYPSYPPDPRRSVDPSHR